MIKEQEKCESLIDGKLKSRIHDFESVYYRIIKDSSLNQDEKTRAFFRWLRRYILLFEELPYSPKDRKMLLSYDDSIDYFIFFHDGTIKYYYSEGGEVAVRKVDDGIFVLWYVYEQLFLAS